MFIDRRFGEYDEKMTLEEKMMKRFTMEKKVFLFRVGKRFQVLCIQGFFSLVYGIFNLKTNDLPEYLFNLGVWYTKLPMAVEEIGRVLGVLCWHNYFHCNDNPLADPAWWITMQCRFYSNTVSS